MCDHVGQQHQQHSSLSALSSSIASLVEDDHGDAEAPALRLVHQLRVKPPTPVFALDVVNNEALVGAAGSVLERWSLRDFQPQAAKRLVGHVHCVTALSVAARGRLLHAASRDGIKTWDLATGECVVTRSGLHRGTVHAMCVTGADGDDDDDDDDGLVWTGGQDCAVHVWPARSAARVALLKHHTGFVYALLAAGPVVYSGAGDALIVEWQDGLPAHSLRGHTGAVMGLALDDQHLFSASRDQTLRIWSRTTRQALRTLPAQHELLSVAVTSSAVYCATEAGNIMAWLAASWVPLGAVSATFSQPLLVLRAGSNLLHAGSSDGIIRSFEECTQSPPTVPSPLSPLPPHHHLSASSSSPTRGPSPSTPSGTVVQLLSHWVGFRSISGNPRYSKDCWEAAEWLSTLAIAMGLDARLEHVPDANPVVYIRAGLAESARTITVYGHYDVVHCEQAAWRTDPWTLTGVDGYLYGRGATDDKGPMLAALVAVAELVATGRLTYNVRFIVEGNEESGSPGTLASIAQHADWLAPATDVLIVSNNYWIDAEHPSIVYGLRGVIHFRVTVKGPLRSNHSGVDGGAYREPLVDLMALCGQLHGPVGDTPVTVPGFYDRVRPITPQERALYADIQFDVAAYEAKTGLGSGLLLRPEPEALLMNRWRHPTLSVTGVEASNAGNPTIIPKEASATVSMRTVPDQQHPELIAAFERFLRQLFAGTGSRNTLSIDVVSEGDWWLAEMGQYTQWAERAIQRVWQRKPTYTREGGSVPLLRKLERQLRCKALILPLGQDGDNAHLANERISLSNLIHGTELFTELFSTRMAEEDQ